jgi:hypothetical protein
MIRNIILLAALGIALAAALLWWPAQSSTPPSIRILAPAGGEAWQTGEKHDISWDARSVDPAAKVAVTIRRIPPPALQEEGQEFDPVIFTDLPNTGSVEWKISPMYPDGTYVLGLHAYDSLPAEKQVSAESEPFTIAHPKLHPDLYPLYDGVDWQASEAESVVIGTTTYAGAYIASQAIPAGDDPAGVFTPFERYYDTKLRAAGWMVANDLAAGGHTGGQTGYRKDGSVILTHFNIKYQTTPENAPSECPCEVTLSLFSATY